MAVNYRRSVSLDTPMTINCSHHCHDPHPCHHSRPSEPVDIPVDVPWPEKCAWHRTGSIKSHFVHLSDTLATDDIPLTGFRSGSVDSQLVSSTSEKSDSSLAQISDSDDGKENDSTKAVDIGNQQKDGERSVWYLSSDPVAIPTTNTITQVPATSSGTWPPANTGTWTVTNTVTATTASAVSQTTSCNTKTTSTNPVTRANTVPGLPSIESVTKPISELVQSLSGNGGEKLSLCEKPSSPEKKVSRVKPKGTITYEVAGRDSLESIAAHHDTTPSELKKLNRLVSHMIFPGQVLYIPDPDYVSSSDPEPSSPELSISPPSLSPPPDTRIRVDVPLVRMADKPPEKVPGHVERQMSSSSVKDKLEPELPHKLTEEEAQQLDQECFERFIKINVKHITDGQTKDGKYMEVGVVSGTLIVTPNAVMFDPNVSDPLVIEHGAESYGMITPMDMVISAAMYHDIAAMRLRGKKHEDRATSPRPEVYHDKTCPLFHSLAAQHEKSKDHVDAALADDGVGSNNRPSRSSTLESLKSDNNSVCSCGVLSQDQSANVESPDLNGNDKLPGEEASKSGEELKSETELPSESKNIIEDTVTDTDSTMGAVKSKKTPGEIETSEKLVDLDSTFDENDNSRLGADSELNPPESRLEISSVGTDVTEDEGFSDDANVTDDKGNRKTDASDQDSSVATTDVSDLGQTFLSQGDPKLSFTLSGEEPKSVILNNAALGESSTEAEPKSENVEKENTESTSETRIGNIVYLPVEKNSDGTLSVGGTETESSTDDHLALPNVTSAAESAASVTVLESQAPTDQPDAGFRPFHTPAKHLSNFVNYATGLFRKESDDRINVEDVSEVVLTNADKTPIMSLTSDRIREVESAIKLEDKPELFQTFDKLIARPAVRMEDPPLYLCLRVGHPKNKEVSQTCPIESFRTNKKKPEYWFSIPRDKVDQLYAFFVQWTPEIYGDEDDIDPETRGFVVIEDESELTEEQLEIVDEHFSASIQKIRKDWEIISKEEAIRRMSTIEIEDQQQLPDMIGETKLLTEEQLTELSQNMPARTIGYSWNLIYSTELHGFSLKTLYRDMSHVDSPILLVVADTNNHVFGAVTNCAFKLSDHFYGTGESFLYTFYPEFKVFHWTGENNFFIKGNKESLAIGAGQGQFGLWLDGDLYHGRSHKCDTFDNDVLTDKEDFVLKGLEAWAFL